MKYLLSTALTIVISLSVFMPVHAEEENDSAYNELYARFISLYNSSSPNTAEQFYQAAEELSTYYRKHDNPMSYYKTQLNICFYDTNKGRSLEALKRANTIVKEMEEEGFDAYSQVYQTLGSIFESRGNYRMARHFYDKSLSTIITDDEIEKINIYLRIASLSVFRDPIEAEYWIKKSNDGLQHSSYYKQVSLFIEGMINFVVGNKYDFKKSYDEYLSFHNKNKTFDNYGMTTLSIADMAFNGQYEEALDKLHKNRNNELTTLDYYEMQILIYKMMKDYEKACQVEQQKVNYTDSLNSDMFFMNMNELNAQIGLAQTQNKANKDREVMLYIILVLAILAIGMLALYTIHNRRRKEELKEKNEQLRSALQMAEESEKMKTEFVRSVSHEIRTPLNAINGFNDILNTPGLPLSEEERADLLSRIQENVKAITDIVDEMLRMADKESNDLYSKRKKIFCNQFLSSIIYQYRDKVSPSIELKYTTQLINRFQIETNEDGVRKILDQVITNAIKFTKSGFIELHAELIENDQQIAISVTDTGKGVSKEMQDKVFDGFSKEDSFEQGIGLGLTVSKKTAVKLGGDLTLDKTYTDGARFVLTLPVSTDSIQQ